MCLWCVVFVVYPCDCRALEHECLFFGLTVSRCECEFCYWVCLLCDSALSCGVRSAWKDQVKHVAVEHHLRPYTCPRLKGANVWKVHLITQLKRARHVKLHQKHTQPHTCGHQLVQGKTKQRSICKQTGQRMRTRVHETHEGRSPGELTTATCFVQLK